MLLEALTDQQFRDAVANSPTLLVVFYHRSCPACASYKPVVKDWCRRNEQMVYLVDVGRFDAIADEYRIRALPTTVMFSAGKPSARAAGMMSATKLQNFVTRGIK